MTVVVTGAGSGIGEAVAKRLAKNSQVIGIGRTADKLEQVASSIGRSFTPVTLDVSQSAQVTELAKSLAGQRGEITALINCAGFAGGGTVDQPFELLAERWNAVMATNLTGSFLMAMAISPLLKRPGGRIVFVSSIAAYTGGRSKGSAIYAASKSGLHGLTMGLARELSAEGITVNAIAPGFVAETGFTGNWPAERVDAIIAETPVGRAGTADEIAAAIEFLCSPDAGFITGEILNQNGGWRFGN